MLVGDLYVLLIFDGEKEEHEKFQHSRQKVEQSALSKILNSIIFSSNEKSTGLSHWIRTNCLV